VSINEREYPNEYLGWDTYEDPRSGATNQVSLPLRLATESGVTGSIFHSGAGAPGMSGATGDFYFRTDGSTGIYRCTTGGGTTGVTWTELI